jgi:hypothetical protein
MRDPSPHFLTPKHCKTCHGTGSADAAGLPISSVPSGSFRVLGSPLARLERVRRQNALGGGSRKILSARHRGHRQVGHL